MRLLLESSDCADQRVGLGAIRTQYFTKSRALAIPHALSDFVFASVVRIARRQNSKSKLLCWFDTKENDKDDRVVENTKKVKQTWQYGVHDDVLVTLCFLGTSIISSRSIEEHRG